jgi:hypothetical protein
MTTLRLLRIRVREIGERRPFNQEVLGWGVSMALCVAAVSPLTAEERDAQMTIKPHASVHFAPIDARRPDGPQIAVLWGDPATGPSAMFLKIARGVGAPHVHTSDYHLLVVEGVMQHWGAGEAEADAAELPVGSYWFQPGNEAHTDACVTEQCVMFVTWSGKRDAKLASPAK